MSTTTVDITPIQNHVWQKVSELQGMLLKQDPRLPGHLKEIHANLIQYEELAHLLSDEQIQEMMKAQKQVTGTMLVTKTVKASNATLTKQAKQWTSDDL